MNRVLMFVAGMNACSAVQSAVGGRLGVAAVSGAIALLCAIAGASR